MTITKEALTDKINRCIVGLQQYESIISNKIKVHDSHLTDIATAFRQLKSDLYSLCKDEKISNGIDIDNDVISGHVEKQREKLYIRAAELLSTIAFETKAATK